jgi:hypothetical protein
MLALIVTNNTETAQARVDGELVKFAKTNYGNQGNDRKVMSALRANIISMQDILRSNIMNVKGGADDDWSKLNLRVECEQVLNKLLSLTLQRMKDERLNGWIHMPPTSREHKSYTEQFVKAMRRLHCMGSRCCTKWYQRKLGDCYRTLGQITNHLQTARRRMQSQFRRRDKTHSIG